jgi:hypothetical protein
MTKWQTGTNRNGKRQTKERTGRIMWQTKEQTGMIKWETEGQRG